MSGNPLPRSQRLTALSVTCNFGRQLRLRPVLLPSALGDKGAKFLCVHTVHLLDSTIAQMWRLATDARFPRENRASTHRRPRGLEGLGAVWPPYPRGRKRGGRLHLARPGEHVHGPGGREAVAQIAQAAHVAGERCRIAGDVDDARGGALRGGAQHGLLAAAPPGGSSTTTSGRRPCATRRGRTSSQAPWRNSALPTPLRAAFSCASRTASGTISMPRRAGLPRQRKADGARAAVRRPRRAPARERAERRRLRVEPLGLRRVDLVKGEGREAEAQAAELVLQSPSPKRGRHRRPRISCVGRGLTFCTAPRSAGTAACRGVAQGLLCRQRGGGGHERRQRLAPAVGAHNEVPHEPAPRPLVVRGDAVGAHPGQHGRAAAQDASLCKGQSCAGTRSCVPRPTKPRRGSCAVPPRAEGRLVAVAPGVFHAENRQEVERLRPAHARKKPGDLGLQRSKVRG